MKISTILATKGANVVTIRPDQSVKEAAAALAEHRIGVLIVVDDAGRAAGILSERDIVRGVARADDILTQPVSAVMTRRVLTGSPQDDLMSVLRTMTEQRFRHLPILDGGQLAGIISIGDVIKAQLDEYEGEVETLETQIIEG
jgi:CBS domain-containing protein